MVFCVNDGAVMTAWQKDQGADDSLLTFYGDPSGALTKALGMVLDHPGPQGKRLFGRTKRFAAIVKNGVVKALEISERPDDRAVDARAPGAARQERALNSYQRAWRL